MTGSPLEETCHCWSSGRPSEYGTVAVTENRARSSGWALEGNQADDDAGSPITRLPLPVRWCQPESP
ncbi:hypothetical protein C8046_15290 [Serinibacter arcticus]|uniref:Uncharacterized protein n=1 Tax=Serinibacter arcticus TaxID=1655435 RepID=A0A2U1ZXT6_9MICO|nr:hypothetical protein C8046_15290 [Serinibacter arcticus]